MADILLVDDDRQVLGTLGQKLHFLGYECRAETSGDSAWGYLNENPVSLAVLDVMIPGISGFELCRRIRKEPRLFGVQVLFLSSMSSEEEIAHGLAQGADDYVAKPFHLEELTRRIERLLSTGKSEKLTDDLTSMPGSKSIKLEIQKRIYDRQPFDLVYAQLLSLNDVARVSGPQVRERAVRHFARALQKCGEKVESNIFCAGHMGGGHFVSMVEPGLCKPFCQTLEKFWDKYQASFYAGAGLERQYGIAIERPGTEGAAVLMDTLICATHHDPDSKETAHELLEVLSHIRESALEQARTGVMIDRRGTSRA